MAFPDSISSRNNSTSPRCEATNIEVCDIISSLDSFITFFLELTSSLAAFVKAGEKERFVAVTDSVDTSDVEGGDFMFKGESLSGSDNLIFVT